MVERIAKERDSSISSSIRSLSLQEKRFMVRSRTSVATASLRRGMCKNQRELRPQLPASGLQIETSELPSIQNDDLALIAADESDDVEFMQPR